MYIHAKKYGLTGHHPRKDTRAIQRALNEGKNKATTVFIPKGTYHLTRALVIYAQTTLILEPGAVFIRASHDTLLKNGRRFKKYYGYDGNGQITIYGGTFDMNGQHINDSNTAMCLGHAKDITIVNVTFKNIVGGHAIDACGINGLFIHGCRFLGFRDDDGTRFFSEAIQLDIQVEGAFPKFGATDGTITQNVIIDRCYFGDSDAQAMRPWNRAIGGHASLYDQYYKSIFIFRNYFDGMQSYAVTPLKADGLYIAHNLFHHCAGGIRLLAAANDRHAHNLDGYRRGTQAGRHLYIYHNQFIDVAQKDTIHIRSYHAVPHRDVVISKNVFEAQSQMTCHIQDVAGLCLEMIESEQCHVQLNNIKS